jgi:hypothetical protein
MSFARRPFVAESQLGLARLQSPTMLLGKVVQATRERRQFASPCGGSGARGRHGLNRQPGVRNSCMKLLAIRTSAWEEYLPFLLRRCFFEQAAHAYLGIQ